MITYFNCLLWPDNFEPREFSKSGTTRFIIPDELWPNACLLAWQLQVIRDVIGKPINISSGYRTPEYNKEIGGAKKSQHLFAKAADIAVDDIKPLLVATTITELIDEERIIEGGVGLYKNFVHYDIRGSRARWEG